MRARVRLLGAFGLAGAMGLASCAPDAPPGVDRDELDAAISKAIGGSATCVVIGQAGSGRVLYRYNTATACDRELPACDVPGVTKIAVVLKTTAKDSQPRTLSCNSAADASRGVGWASGPIAGTDLVYAAMMEGDRAFPGRMMAERLARAFQKVGLQPAS